MQFTKKFQLRHCLNEDEFGITDLNEEFTGRLIKKHLELISLDEIINRVASNIPFIINSTPNEQSKETLDAVDLLVRFIDFSSEVRKNYFLSFKDVNDRKLGEWFLVAYCGMSKQNTIQLFTNSIVHITELSAYTDMEESLFFETMQILRCIQKILEAAISDFDFSKNLLSKATQA